MSQDDYTYDMTPYEAEVRLVPDDDAFALADTTFDAPPNFLRRLDGEIEATGGEVPPDPALAGSLGRTMFDLPSSEDGSVTVLLPQDSIKLTPSQALVRIKSRDERRYLGIVTAGPFAEPTASAATRP